MVYKSIYESCRNIGRAAPDETEDRLGSTGFAGGHQGKKEHEDGPGLRLWPKTLDELLVKYPCCPPDAFINIKEFYNNPHLNHIDYRR